MKKIALTLLATLIVLAGCRKGDKTPQVKDSPREPKTSYGIAIDQAKKAAKTTEEAQRREAEEALGDIDDGTARKDGD